MAILNDMHSEIDGTFDAIDQFARERLGGDVDLGHVETKTGLDIVTDRDLEMERALIDLIARRHPGHVVYAEETADARRAAGSSRKKEG